MSLIPSDVMLSVFKLLNSREMVQVMLVSKQWLEIIDENRALWRRLILPSRENGWDRSAVEVFDKKSNSTLKEVSMELSSSMDRYHAASFVQTLEKSRQTIEVLALTEINTERQFYELPKKLPDLIDCRFLRVSKSETVHIVRKKSVENPGIEDNQDSKLKVLWLHLLLGINQSHRLENVQSFHLLRPILPSTCREVLSVFATTLKDLQISPGYHSEYAIEAVGPEPLDFPLLEVLQLSRLNTLAGNRFPSWIRIPLKATLCIDSAWVPTSLPSVSTLWLGGLINVEVLTSCCPELVTLRVDGSSYSNYSVGYKDELISTLKTRKGNAEAGMEVSGVKMIPLKTIVLQKSFFGSEQLSEISELVEEVVDLDSVPKFIEVEI